MRPFRKHVIEIFTSQIIAFIWSDFCRVCLHGQVDERIRLPRRPQPRVKVPKGSVAIAGSQTGVYPLETPGGWHILGHTETDFFLPDQDPPSLLKPGDRCDLSLI